MCVVANVALELIGERGLSDRFFWTCRTISSIRTNGAMHPDEGEYEIHGDCQD